MYEGEKIIISISSGVANLFFRGVPTDIDVPAEKMEHGHPALFIPSRISQPDGLEGQLVSVEGQLIEHTGLSRAQLDIASAQVAEVYDNFTVQKSVGVITRLGLE